MADEDTKPPADSDDGSSTTPPGGDTKDPKDSPGESKKDLSTASTEELIGIIGGLRKSEATYRVKAKEVDDLTASVADLTAKVKVFEDASKTAEEKATEAREALEAKALQADSLSPYAAHVKAELDGEMAQIDGIEDEDRKKAYTDLLDSFGENDHLLRLKAIRALRSAEGLKQKNQGKDGDEDHPGRPSLGEAEKGLISMIGWDTEAVKSARLTGDLPKATK